MVGGWREWRKLYVGGGPISVRLILFEVSHRQQDRKRSWERSIEKVGHGKMEGEEEKRQAERKMWVKVMEKKIYISFIS